MLDYQKKATKIALTHAVTYIIFIILIAITSIFAEYYTKRKVEDITTSYLKCYEQGNVDYKVYYKPNKYFPEEYIEKDKTYVTSLIDHIDIDYTYHLNFSDKVKANVKYYMKATIIANKSEDVYWERDYPLTEELTASIINENDYILKTSTSVKYQDYQDILNEFNSTLNLYSDAKLKIGLVVSPSTIESENGNISFDDEIYVEMPLSNELTEMKISSTIPDYERTSSYSNDNFNKKVLSRIIGGILWFVDIILIITFAFIYNNNKKRESTYKRELRKIINTYDYLIVNSEKLPSLKEMKVVTVTSFDELLDVQNKLKQPINLKLIKNPHQAKFVLIKNNLAWVYTLKEGGTHEKKR